MGGDENISGLVFVALMFIGGGVGLLLGRPEVGGAIGMGLGFLAMAYIKYQGVKVKAEKSVSIKGSIGVMMLAMIGFFFIMAGIALFFNIKYIMRYAAGLAAVAIGLAFLSAAFKLLVK